MTLCRMIDPADLPWKMALDCFSQMPISRKRLRSMVVFHGNSPAVLSIRGFHRH